MSTPEKTTQLEVKPEDWMTSKWRPAMGWMYMAVCVFDFIIFPILWSMIQSVDPQGSVITPWTPLTLQGSGLFHVAMGAVLGVTSYGRTQEKLAFGPPMVAMPPAVTEPSSVNTTQPK